MADEQWKEEKARQLYELPLIDLLLKAQSIHQQHFKANEIELCTLLSIKTGACPEDCAYCSQSGHYQTSVMREKLWKIEDVIAHAKASKEQGATRYCMGAAWRRPPKKDFSIVLDMIKAIKAIGLETCVTLGMLNDEEVQQLKDAGLDFYNHNLDTSPNYYKKIITTHTYEDRLVTLQRVAKVGIHTCCGGIIGMGESREDRIKLLIMLANLKTKPFSVPINRLSRIKGTPLENAEIIDNFEFIRTIALARIMIPSAVVRLSAGRNEMSQEMQALCFMAGANSMWLGNKLLTTQNPETDSDVIMFKKLGLVAKKQHFHHDSNLHSLFTK